MSSKGVRVVAMAVALVGSSAAAWATDLPGELAPVLLSETFTGAPVTDSMGVFSLRNLDESAARVVPNDVYGAALIGQTVSAAAFLTVSPRTTVFTFDGTGEVHGNLVGSGATVRVAEAQFDLDPTTVRVVVSLFTEDSSALFLTGLSISGNPIIQGRMDVGAGGGATGGPLLGDESLQFIQSVTIRSALFEDGNLVALSSPLLNSSTLPNMSSIVVWNGVVGTDIDEIAMLFDVTYIPEPATLGLLAPVVALMGRRRSR